jgi:hypothetical protein
MMMNCPMMPGGQAGQDGIVNCPMMTPGQTQGMGPGMMQGMGPGQMQPGQKSAERKSVTGGNDAFKPRQSGTNRGNHVSA